MQYLEIYTNQILLYPSKDEQKKMWKNAQRRLKYQINRKKILARNKKWRESNPDKVKLTLKNYKQKNPEKIKAMQHAYYKANSDELRAYWRDYYKTHTTEVLLWNKAWRSSNRNKFRSTNKAWVKANRDKWNGYVDARRRELGNDILNYWFDGCNRHHITKNQVVCIPVELHQQYSHNHNKPETMHEINKIAFEYLTNSIRQL